MWSEFNRVTQLFKLLTSFGRCRRSVDSFKSTRRPVECVKDTRRHVYGFNNTRRWVDGCIGIHARRTLLVLGRKAVAVLLGRWIRGGLAVRDHPDAVVEDATQKTPHTRTTRRGSPHMTGGVGRRLPGVPSRAGIRTASGCLLIFARAIGARKVRVLASDWCLAL